MKKHKMLIFLVLSVAALRGQAVITSYTPRLISGKGILDITETYAPPNSSGFVRTVNVYNADTASMRAYIISERAYQLTEVTRLQGLADEAQAKADSLYAALVEMNSGLGAVDDAPKPLREPQKPSESPARWGAILPNDENEIG